MSGFTIQAEGSRQSILSSRWFRILFPFLILVIMGVGALGLGIYRQYLETRRGPWLEAVSTPPGATVFLNGRFAGATPLRLENLEAGTYALRFEKLGHDPLIQPVQLEKPGSKVEVDLKPLSAGRLVIELEPKGAEVLLDGVLTGHTPLTLGDVPAGPHELIVRRTNFQPFVRRLQLQAAETQTFANIALKDLVLKSLQDRWHVEPWRISNATELATYLFLAGQQTEAAEVTMQAMDAAVRPPEYPVEFLPDDRANEQRLRGDDIGRLNHMLGRMWSWPGHDTANYRDRLGKPDGALKLLAFRLQLHDRGSAYHTAMQVMQNAAKDSETLAIAVRMIMDRKEQYQERDFEPLLKAAEQMARTAYGIDHAAGALAMAEWLAARNASVEALNYLRESLAQQSPENAWEDRALRGVVLLQVLGQRDEARGICERLTRSGRPAVKAPADELLKQLK